jgi:hypothetical protein
MDDLARYRNQWDITEPEPLGGPPRDLVQAHQHNALVAYLDHHWGGHTLAEPAHAALAETSAPVDDRSGAGLDDDPQLAFDLDRSVRHSAAPADPSRGLDL